MKKFFLCFVPGLIAGALIIVSGGKALNVTSTNNYCVSCHVHPMADAYSKYPEGIIKDQKGPEEGTEHVLRGGSFLSTAGLLRSAARDYTRTEEWLRTDPQMPKSIWWYSDCFNVGFRVVCEFDNKTGNL